MKCEERGAKYGKRWWKRQSKTPRAHRSSLERGSVFIVTLAVLIGIVGLIATLAATNREFSRAQWNRMADRRARLMIEAGIQRAVAELQQQDSSHVTQTDKWASLGEQGDDTFRVGRDGFRLQILDASARIDVNKAEEAQLKKLTLTSEQVDSLIDWREDGSSPRPEGAKNEYYNRLANAYNAKLKPLDSLDELLQVRGFTPDTLLKPIKDNSALNDLLTVDSASADKDVAGKQKLDINSATSEQLVQIGVPQSLAEGIIQARSFKTMGDVLKVQNMTSEAARTLVDNTAIGSDAQHTGLINLNTAPEAVLKTIPDLSEGVARDIVVHQRAGFRSIGDMLDLPGMNLGDFAKVVDRFCVGSRAFIVRVIGKAAGRSIAAEATLTLDDNGEVQIKRIQPVLYPYARDGWGWLEQPSHTVNLGVAD